MGRHENDGRRREKFDILFRNHTKVKKEKRRRFYTKIMNFIQEEMSTADEDPEITKIKAMIKNSKNKNFDDDELTKVKQSLQKDQRNNPEIQKIKAIIHDKGDGGIAKIKARIHPKKSK